MNFKIKKSHKLVLFSIFLVSGISFIVFNEYGILKLLRAKDQVRSLNEQIEILDKENKVLEGSVDSLQRKIPYKMEETAREKYNMKKTDETYYKIETK